MVLPFPGRELELRQHGIEFGCARKAKEDEFTGIAGCVKVIEAVDLFRLLLFRSKI